MPNQIVTLLTDFGLRDFYVGVMKGVIAQINPQVNVIDLTHEIPPQNIAAGRFCLMNGWRYFPEGTVHIAVVDPGVGSARRAIALRTEKAFFVGPDNGLLSGIVDETIIAAVELTNADYWLTPAASATFHGRDIFAPVGAHLASGIPLEQLGKSIDPTRLIQLPLAPCQLRETQIAGCVQYIDYFGNLITNIAGEMVQGRCWSVQVGDRIISSGQTYADTEVGNLISLIGSSHWVEIAVRGGSAQRQLQIDWGAPVQILLHP